MADSDDGSVRAVEHPALTADRPLVDLRQDHRRLHRLLPVHGLLHGLSYRLRLARRRYDAEHGRPRLALRLPPRHIPAAVLADDGSVAAAHQPADVRRYGAGQSIFHRCHYLHCPRPAVCSPAVPELQGSRRAPEEHQAACKGSLALRHSERSVAHGHVRPVRLRYLHVRPQRRHDVLLHLLCRQHQPLYDL